MTGALRPHHRNNYCIIYSVSPLVQGERTHINLQARHSAPHSGCCLLGSRLSSLHSFFPPPLPSSYILWSFLFVWLLLSFFPSSWLPSCGAGMVHQHHGALSLMWTHWTLPPPFLLYFLLSFVFQIFMGAKTFSCCWFFFHVKSLPECSLDSQWVFFIVIIIIITMEEMSRWPGPCSDRAAGRHDVDLVCYIMGLIDGR